MALDFAQSVMATALKQLSQVDKKIEGMAVELFTEVVNFSPTQPAARYAKGHFINNWQAVINGQSNVTISALSLTGAASRDSINRLKSMKTFLARDGYVTLSNSVSYANLVEYAGWPKSINPRWTGTLVPSPYAPIRTAWTKVVPKFKTGGTP